MGLATEAHLFDVENGVALCRQCHKKRHAGGTYLQQLPEGKLFLAIQKHYKTVQDNLPDSAGFTTTFGQFYERQMEKIITGYKNKNLPEQT